MLDLQATNELLQSLKASGEYEALAKALADVPVFLALWQENEKKIVELWEELARYGHHPERYYRVSVAEVREHDPSLLPEAIITIYLLLRELGNPELSSELLSELMTELLAWAETHGDNRRLMQAHEGLSYVRYTATDYLEAQHHAEEALRFAESLSDSAGQIRAARALGQAYLRLRRFEAAKYAFAQQYHFADAIGDHSSMCNALGNKASVLIDEERHAEAREVCNQQIELAKSVGNTMGIVYAHMNLGIIFFEMRRLDDAIETLREGLQLALSVGNRREATIILGNLGNYMIRTGKPEEGYPMILAALDAHREMGFPQGMTHWLNALAEMYCEAAFATDYPAGFLIDFVDLEPGEDWRPAVRRMAWKYAEEGHRLSQDLKKYDTSYASAVVLARVEAAEGYKAKARERLEESLDMLTDTLRISDCYAWLWRLNLGTPQEVEEYRRTALELEEEMYTLSPRADLLAEIEELRRGEILGRTDGVE